MIIIGMFAKTQHFQSKSIDVKQYDKSSRLQGYLAYFPASALKVFPSKKFLIFFPKKTCSERVSYIFSKKAFLIFRKRNFFVFRKVYSEPWRIQNPGIFRNRGIFRTLSNIYDGTFCKNSYLAYFYVQAKKKLKQIHPEKISYISGNETFYLQD